ncbi:DUF1844 domain-containing protein [Desulfonema ishimotonii]|uniref:DUF1844 domain-containing protein n=1 Tax=Desulfonema ishimotonii TaxID=45657 RepID=A0A401FZ23_9BACT|nr:DUF1844 domain-containing protein [Desulfonema ishimotonii]GBC62186.1 DUF1844 domain-containing protein [Desulfonema ishimotonii]
MTEEKISAEGQTETGKKGAAADPLPKMDFSMFIFSLNSSALVHLGIIEDPATGQKVKNLPAAKQTIDILGMLEKKTTGNLNHQEEEMLKHILYDLRVIYVKEQA